ncbi:hypothetical protein UF64_16195 [Thalassospira sp. HJ]|uniref:AbiJ-NTD4 domain-containing protein n=1 Tax=Thalassospira sp. HJ TaxID=1616823 RepID=UPI0005CE092D|nr:hypothetical protein [Thalassospira sp. HJ]KJE33982.1 hypothetical protein UF64_16195 [Thalassospira sp. HJ]
MRRFSERNGYVDLASLERPEWISEHTRNRLWSIVFMQVFERFNRAAEIRHNIKLKLYCEKVWYQFFRYPIDAIPKYSGDAAAEIKAFMLQGVWYEVFDFVEFNLAKFSANNGWQGFVKSINRALEEERSAYRVVGGMVTLLRDVEETAEIKQAIDNDGPFAASSAHLKASLALYSKRPDPDYRNAIKEAISAVESACAIISGSNKDTLGQTLKKIDGLHPAMRDSFQKLYGYTSDGSGIRHAMLEEAEISNAEARFMIVACSAFVNYLIDSTKSKIA